MFKRLLARAMAAIRMLSLGLSYISWLRFFIALGVGIFFGLLAIGSINLTAQKVPATVHEESIDERFEREGKNAAIERLYIENCKRECAPADLAGYSFTTHTCNCYEQKSFVRGM